MMRGRPLSSDVFSIDSSLWNEDTDRRQVMILSPALEKYLLAIFNVTRRKRVARVKDVAALLRVSSASVSPAMHRLDQLGLVHYGRREYIELSPSGTRLAELLLCHQEIVAEFFERSLRLSRAEAKQASASVFHFFSDDLLGRIREYLAGDLRSTESITDPRNYRNNG